MTYVAILNNRFNMNDKALHELKKYFPVVSNIHKFYDNRIIVTVHRGKKKLNILIHKGEYSIGLSNVSIKQVSKNFNTIYELSKNRDEAFNKYTIACREWDAYMSWMNNEQDL